MAEEQPPPIPPQQQPPAVVNPIPPQPIPSQQQPPAVVNPSLPPPTWSLIVMTLRQSRCECLGEKNDTLESPTQTDKIDSNKVIIEDWVERDDKVVPEGFSKVKKKKNLKSVKFAEPLETKPVKSEKNDTLESPTQTDKIDSHKVIIEDWVERDDKVVPEGFSKVKKKKNLKSVKFAEPLETKPAVANGNGTIDYNEFITATMHMNRKDRKEHLYTAFQYFDKDNIGCGGFEEKFSWFIGF
ncbi:Calcium-dependent protein kinase 17 [Artemisia annua]|uniref:Calcium-dependent protein kinase 17 n=1 Tax=Artemisia annua TaxID=35608 RepID=A0A2U1Q0V0_ARTAN|nr:Calcium-dependent protein kinase 17 [Artemisia annua]